MHFKLDGLTGSAGGPPLRGEWEKKKVNKTTDLEELVDYLAFPRSGGVIPLRGERNENAVRLMTVHGAKGLEFPHVFILRANRQLVSLSYQRDSGRIPQRTAGSGFRHGRPTTRRCTIRKSAACSMWR